VTARAYTVSCAEHGEMVRDSLRYCWLCPDGECGARLDDEDVFRLVSTAPASLPDPLPLVVT
jgi:hypothetical protein